MEILQSFFDEAETIISEYMKKGYYEGEGEPKPLNHLNMLEAILNGDKEALDREVDDVAFGTSAESISELNEKLLSLPSEKIIIYAKMIAEDLDGKLFNVYCGMRNLETYEWSIDMLKRGIRDYTRDIVDSFAKFDIDLVDYLKQNDGDFEMEFGAYDEYRSEQFLNPVLKGHQKDESKTNLDDKIISLVYKECNKVLWKDIKDEEDFKPMMKSGNLNITIIGKNKQRVYALFNRLSSLIPNNTKWVENIETSLGIERLNKISKLDETNSDPNKKFNSFLDKIYKK